MEATLKNAISAIAVAAALATASAAGAHAAECSATVPLPGFLGGPTTVPFNCPDPVQGPQGEAGLNGADGRDGADGAPGLNGRDFNLDKSLALSAAISTPVWLGDSENFAVSGGVGFSDSETAIGFNGVMRFDRTWSGFAGGAISQDGETWSGRAGLRAGW